MAETPHDPNDLTPQDPLLVPQEEPEEDPQNEQPRRAASAQFVVQSQPGSASVLREAMDPANQSLAEALRLSYRVLQIVIAVLIVLFLVSGFRSIKDAETGVQTLFGQIQGDPGEEALEPGPAISFWPYPAAEFIVFNRRGSVDLLDTFWPDAQIGRGTYDQPSGQVEFHTAMRPGLGPNRDGMIVMRDGLGHIQLQAQYIVSDPVRFVERIPGQRHADHIVRLALQRGTIHAGANANVDQAIGQEDVLASRVKSAAQQFLDSVGCGIQIERVQVTNFRPPIAIQSAIRLLSEAQNQAMTAQSEARQQRNSTLVQAAGDGYREVLALIEQYETVILESEQGVRSPEAKSILASIETLLQSEDVGGEVAQIIASANTYKEQIDSTLGSYAKRYASLLPSYQSNPEFVVKQHWIDTYSRVLSREDAEVFQVPGEVRTLGISVTSSHDVMLKRREFMRERRQQAARSATGLGGIGAYQPQLGERDIGRRLQLTEEGRVQGRNQ